MAMIRSPMSGSFDLQGLVPIHARQVARVGLCLVEDLQIQFNRFLADGEARGNLVGDPRVANVQTALKRLRQAFRSLLNPPVE